MRTDIEGKDDLLSPGDGAAIVPQDEQLYAERVRLFDIDRAKGFAIALVVWGHLASATIGQSPLWFYISVAVIYSFHMPFFMYLSGFVFFLSGGPDRFWRNPGSQILARADRLLVPFAFFGILVVTGKYFAGTISGVADPVNSIGEGLTKVAINAPNNPSASIWYLLVLFIYTIVTPILWKISNRRIFFLIIAGMLLWITPATEYFYLNKISIYFIFFAIGGACAIYKNGIINFFSKFYLLFLLIFLIVLIFLFDSKYALILCGAASIPAIHGLFLQRMWGNDRFFVTLGAYSMAIYLLNTIFLGVFRILSVPAISKLHPPFVAVILSFFVVGLIGPVVFRFAANRFGFLHPATRYLD